MPSSAPVDNCYGITFRFIPGERRLTGSSQSENGTCIPVRPSTPGIVVGGVAVLVKFCCNAVPQYYQPQSLVIIKLRRVIFSVIVSSFAVREIL